MNKLLINQNECQIIKMVVTILLFYHFEALFAFPRVPLGTTKSDDLKVNFPYEKATKCDFEK